MWKFPSTRSKSLVRIIIDCVNKQITLLLLLVSTLTKRNITAKEQQQQKNIGKHFESRLSASSAE